MGGEGLEVCLLVDPTPRPVSRIDLGGRRIVVVVDGEAATRIDHMIQNGRLALVPGVSPAQRERQAVEHLVRAFGKGGIARVIEILTVVRSPRDERRGRFDTTVFVAEDDACGVISPTFVRSEEGRVGQEGVSWGSSWW